MGPELCKTLEIRLECHESVCVYVWNSSFKRPKRLKHLQSIFQFIRGIGQNWGKMWYFFKITCVNFTYIILQ